MQARKSDLKFRTKTGKGRTVPLEKTLALRLAAWKMKNSGRRLVFGTKADKEDHHSYRLCRETAERAGMDPDNFWIHKWRETYGTWTSRAGKLDLRTISTLDGAHVYNGNQRDIRFRPLARKEPDGGCQLKAAIFVAVPSSIE